MLFTAREPLPRDRKVYGHLFVMGVLNIAIPFSLITWGETSIDSALASIINASVPLFTILIASLVLVDEPITVNRLVGLLVGFGGVLVLTSRAFGEGTSGSLPGELAMIGSSISYAAGNVYARHNVRGLRPMVQAFFQVFFALVITTILAFAFERPFALNWTGSSIFAVVWLGLLGSGLAYLCFFWLLARWGSTRSSMVAYLLPVVGIVLGFLVLNETIDARVLARHGPRRGWRGPGEQPVRAAATVRPPRARAPGGGRKTGLGRASRLPSPRGRAARPRGAPGRLRSGVVPDRGRRRPPPSAARPRPRR